MRSWSEVVGEGGGGGGGGGGERPLSVRVDDWSEHIQQPLTDPLFQKSLVSCCCRLAYDASEQYYPRNLHEISEKML